MPLFTAPVTLLLAMTMWVPLMLSAWIPAPLPEWETVFPTQTELFEPSSIPAPVPLGRAVLLDTTLSVPPTTENTWDGPVPRLWTTRASLHPATWNAIPAVTSTWFDDTSGKLTTLVAFVPCTLIPDTVDPPFRTTRFPLTSGPSMGPLLATTEMPPCPHASTRFNRMRVR